MSPAVPPAEPGFVLTGPAGTVIAEGVETAYPRVEDARTALASGRSAMVVGALPFDLTAPAALSTPRTVRVTAAPAPWPHRELPAVHVAESLPEPREHRERVATAVTALRAGAGGLRKVVLARSLRLVADAPLDPVTLLGRLAGDPAATAFLADLGPAGPGHAGRVLVGASPELLVSRRGALVSCRPFAGSAARCADPAADADAGAALAASAKNLHEHRLVVEQLHAALAPLCRELSVAAQPELSRTDAMWHLNTPITGRLRQTGTTALDLAVTLHPTAAVAGVPTAAATALIARLEGDRGFYAGAVGWCDGDGDGTWVVALRCAELSSDRREALARAGGGIVAESDPDDELDETTAKFATITAALGVGERVGR